MVVAGLVAGVVCICVVAVDPESARAAPAAVSPCWSPPVDGPVVRPFQAPACPWCPGHRGIEFGAPWGTPVHAVAAGTVTFAGVVAGTGFVTVAVDAGGESLLVTVRVGRAAVGRGQHVDAGATLGWADGGTLLTVRRGDAYLDPTGMLGRWTWPVRLVPIDGGVGRDPGPARLGCAPRSEAVTAGSAAVRRRPVAAARAADSMSGRPPPAGQLQHPADLRSLRRSSAVPIEPQERSNIMAVITLRQMLEAGVHFGHQTRRWNPKMKRFIFGERNGIYIIDLEQTLARVEAAYNFVRDLSAKGGTVLFVGTKKQAQDPVRQSAQQCGMHYVNERWLGGMLTNFETIAKRVGKMQEYERMKTAGDFEAMPKKEALLLGRELEKLQKNLGGIRGMNRRPDAVFVLDTKKEQIAVEEANKLKIPVIAVVDTNVDPDVVQFPIPGNDDAIRANALMANVIAEAVAEGRYIAGRRSAATSPVVAEAPKRSAEDEAAFAAAQADARRQAAAAQAERDAKVAAAKAGKSASEADTAADDAGAVRPVAAAADLPHGGLRAEGDEAPAGHSIKGNADSGLYHTTESPYYGRTKAEMWFDTEANAQAAGFTRWDHKTTTTTPDES